MLTASCIVMDKSGGPDVLKLQSKTLPSLREGEALIAVSYAGINRADLEIRKGNWQIKAATPYPYTPGLEFVGKIQAVHSSEANFAIGESVISMMQKLGGIHGVRPGGYSSHLVVPTKTLVRVPQSISEKALASLGLPAVTAMTALTKLDLKQGENILIQGAAGAVGRIATSLALAKSANVVACVKNLKQAAAFSPQTNLEISVSEGSIARGVEAESMDAILEMIGGEGFHDSVKALKPKGRLLSVGAMKGGNAKISIWDLLQERQVSGWSSENLDRAALEQAVTEISTLQKNGLLPEYLCNAQIFPLHDAAMVHRAIEEGAIFGRVLLKP